MSYKLMSVIRGPDVKKRSKGKTTEGKAPDLESNYQPENQRKQNKDRKSTLSSGENFALSLRRDQDHHFYVLEDLISSVQ